MEASQSVAIRNKIIGILVRRARSTARKSQRECAEALGISKGHVSKIRNKAVKDGFLSAKNKLTQSGYSELSN